MFSNEFNTVYDEAFQSITGFPICTGEFQPKLEQLQAVAVNSLLNHWTSLEYEADSAVTDVFSSRGANLFWMKHPYSAEFTEEDAHDIAKIYSLGMTAIASADTALKHNPAFQAPSFNLKYHNWYYLHPEKMGQTAQLSHDPEAASPVRLANWPVGDYVSCLGISIATAAQAHMDPNVDYVYMNRIRHSQLEVNISLAQISERIGKLDDYAVYAEELIHVASAMKSGTPYNRKCLYDKNRSALFDNLSPDDSFHQAIIRRNKNDKPKFSMFTGWLQHDPYGLVESDLNPRPLEREAVRRFPQISIGRCNEILLYDSDYLAESYKKIGGQVDVATKLQGRLRSACYDYKNPSYLKNIRGELALQKSALFDAMLSYTPGNQIQIQRYLDPDFYRISPYEKDAAYQWFMVLATAASHSRRFSADAEIEKMLEYGSDGQNEDIETLIGRLEGKIMDSVKYDTDLQDCLGAVITSMPYAYALHQLEEWSKMASFDDGTADQTMEICEPGFMIGAMYLNHYARWRNNGRVNVAKEIARLTPSQLIWQAAVADDHEAARDPRVHAVGDLVKGLKYDQQHPLVRLTAHPRRR